MDGLRPNINGHLDLKHQILPFMLWFGKLNVTNFDKCVTTTNIHVVFSINTIAKCTKT